MPWCLIVVDGADLKKSFPLPLVGKVTIGKEPTSFIILNDFYLEKSHCALTIAEDGITVFDTSSDKGIFANGKKVIRAASLYLGDILRVGNTHLRVDLYDGPPPAAPSEEEIQEPTVPLLAFKRMSELQGHKLGRFEIGMVLGKGRHGFVFRARDQRSNEQIALKVLSPDFPSNVDELKKFAQVIKSTAPIAQHENLVHWSGAGKIGPYVWIAQEQVDDGESLKTIQSHPESARYSWRTAWRLAYDVAQALDHLHRQRVFHGNITATNLLISNNGRVKLNDLRFREALAGSVWQEEMKEQKQRAEILYTPPERLEPGVFAHEDAGDIYSLGMATFVRLNSGTPPFPVDDVETTTYAILSGITEKHRRKAGSAPDGFLDIIFKMLSRNQQDRYQNAAELLVDLERFGERK